MYVYHLTNSITTLVFSLLRHLVEGCISQPSPRIGLRFRKRLVRLGQILEAPEDKFLSYCLPRLRAPRGKMPQQIYYQIGQRSEFLFTFLWYALTKSTNASSRVCTPASATSSSSDKDKKGIPLS